MTVTQSKSMQCMNKQCCQDLDVAYYVCLDFPNTQKPYHRYTIALTI